MYIDTHCHLADPKLSNLDQVVSEYLRAGVDTVMTMGCCAQTSEIGYEQSKKYPSVYFASGVHPSDSAGYNNQEKDKVSKIINLKPTKESLAAFSYIEEYLLKNYTLSEFFRNLFSSYCSLPQDEREKIIFKKQYDTLVKAINNKKKVFFTTTQGGLSRHESSPYAISTSKEVPHSSQ